MSTKTDSLISYSLNESERIQSIREWAATPTPDHARHLIQTYRESEWRSTRLEVLRHFGFFKDSRSLQFLISIATKNEDLAEQQLAILALSLRRTRSSQAFLRKFYNSCPDTLKAVLAQALGQSQDFGAIPALLRDWDVAYAKQDWPWLRSLILSLGELKAFHALPRIQKLFEQINLEESELTAALLFATARLERDPKHISRLQLPLLNDPVLNQIFHSTLSQVQIRSQFKLEDYLEKIFTSVNPHPVLPLELKAFDAEEVKLGLSIFSIEKEWRRYLFALQGVASKDRLDGVKQIMAVLQTKEEQTEFLERVSFLIDDENQASLTAMLDPFLKHSDADLRLAALEASARYLNFSKEGAFFFACNDEGLIIRFLNLWSEWELVRGGDSASAKTTGDIVQDWIKQFQFPVSVYGRLLRACVELSIFVPAIATRFAADFKQAGLRSSLLLFAEKFSSKLDAKTIVAEMKILSPAEKESLGQRILAAIESFAEEGTLSMKGDQSVDELLKFYSNHFSAEFRVGVLRILRFLPDPAWEAYAIEQLAYQSALVELNAVISLKKYFGSRDASEALAEKLESKSAIIRGRALDALCEHRSLLAKRAVLDYLKAHLDQDEVVDKIYRGFDPEGKGGEEFSKAVEALLVANPDHPQWEKLVSLRDRLGPVARIELSPENAEALKEVDAKLLQVIPLFDKLDATTKSALRAAEQPFVQDQEFQNLPIDKAPTVLEYCKALDLILEKHLGQKHLFPKLDHQLHDFQTLWHRIGFGEDYPSVDKVMNLLVLKGKITPENFPLHKARMMCGTFFNGKITQDRFKVFDGLRAWAVIFLVFTRKIPFTSGAIGPLLKLPNGTDEKCISVAKRLMLLQDLRNPAAHRQTYTDLASVAHVRTEAIELLNTVLALIL